MAISNNKQGRDVIIQKTLIYMSPTIFQIPFGVGTHSVTRDFPSVLDL